MKSNISTWIFLAVAALLMASCSDGKSYAELLSDENISCNNYLANQKVIGYEERDSTFQFEVGPTAPFYQLDEDANIFMRVLNAGTPGNWAEVDQLIFFRFTRYSLHDYDYNEQSLPEGEGNDGDQMHQSSASFRYANISSSSYTQWGAGLQTPLHYLPIDCQVVLVIKSQFGPSSEIANVVPYVYNVRYFKSMI